MHYKKNAQPILNAINQAQNILLVSHEKPDGDTLGASLALAHFLEKLNKKYKHFCADKPAAYFNFLPKIEKITTDLKTLNIQEHDLIITVDCGVLIRTKIAPTILAAKNNPTIINIDHHDTNKYYGHHNLVIKNASSTSEIVYNFFDFHNIKIDKYMATSLLTGILTDTMNFTNGATTQNSLHIASKLLDQGARLNQIISYLSQNKSIITLRLWGKVLSKIEFINDYNFAYIVISEQDLLEHQMTADDARDGLANFLSLLQEIDFILVLTEQDQETIKGSLRTTKDNVDVAQIAGLFGGGGHTKAAGFNSAKLPHAETEHWKDPFINVIINKLRINKPALTI